MAPTLVATVVVRISFAAGVWAFAWWFGAVQLSFALAAQLTPEASVSRFFFMWTFVGAIYYGMLGALACALFVSLEALWHRSRPRQSSAAGWIAIALGVLSGVVVLVGSMGWRWIAHNETPGEYLLPLAFSSVLGAVCGLATFLIIRVLERRASVQPSATT